MPTVITQHGLDSIANAKAGGFLINLTEFAVTSAESDPKIEDRSLVGTVLYRAKINLVEVVDGHTVKFTIYIPKNVPTTGTFNILEVGVYDDNGALFVHTSLDAPLEKSFEFGVSLELYVSIARLGEVINISTGTWTSIPSTPKVSYLIDPSESHYNAIEVLDQQDNNGVSSPALALKNGIHWGFTGHSRVYLGAIEEGSTTGFALDIKHYGNFWADDAEHFIVQVVSGSSNGVSRKMRYNSDTGRFQVVDKPFNPALSNSSKVAIWKNSANVYPTRKNVPPYYTLSSQFSTLTKEEPKKLVGIYELKTIETNLSAGEDTIILNGISSETYLNKQNFNLFINGQYFEPSLWKLLGSSLVLNTPLLNGGIIEIEVFNYNSNVGGSTYVYEAVYEATINQSRFNLPIIPENKGQVWLFVKSPDDILARKIDRLQYEIEGTSIITSAQINGSDIVTLICFAVAYGDGNSTTSLCEFTTDSGQEYTLTVDVTDVQNTLLFGDKDYIDRSQYFVETNKLIFRSKPRSGMLCNLIVVNNVAGNYDEGTSEVSGMETGPQWTDPIGYLRPTYFKPVRYHYDTEPGLNEFPVVNVYDKNAVLVFLNGIYTEDYSVSLEEQTLSIRTFDSGSLDVIHMYSEFSNTEVGSRVDTYIEKINGNSGKLSFTVDSDDFIMVFADGRYKNPTEYAISGSYITVDGSSKIDVLCYRSSNVSGYTTVLAKSTVKATESKLYGLDNNVGSLPFISGIYQHDAELDFLGTFNVTEIPASTSTVSTICFKNGRNLTHLMSREEIYGKFGVLLGTAGIEEGLSALRKYTDNKCRETESKVLNEVEVDLDSILQTMNEELAKLRKQVQDSEIPPGFEGNSYSGTIPDGWLLRDGSQYNVADYPRLFNAIGYRYGGSGDVFNVPDGRGLVSRALDLDKGIDIDRELGTIQEDAIQNIEGKVGIRAAGIDMVSGPFGQEPNLSQVHVNIGEARPDVGITFDASRVVRTANETRMKNIAVLPLIKY